MQRRNVNEDAEHVEHEDANVHHVDPSTPEIDWRWLDFNDNLVQDVTLEADVGACVPAYIGFSLYHTHISFRWMRIIDLW